MACKPARVALLLVLLPAMAGGQSLGSAAAKERDRREKLRTTGKTSRPLTEDDLANTKGQLANDPNAPPAASPPSRPATADPVETEDARADVEEYWRGRVAEARARLREAQEAHDYMQRVIRLGQPEMRDKNGRIVIYSNQQLKAKADAAEAALAAAKAALESLVEDARRKGALPGWLR